MIDSSSVIVGRIILLLTILCHLHSVIEGAQDGSDTNVIRCRSCGLEITTKDSYLLSSDIPIEASAVRKEPALNDGNVFYFRNPMGLEFEVATFEDVTNIDVVGRTFQEASDSFFQHYVYQVATCPRCASHIGWHYLDSSVHQCQQKPKKKSETTTLPILQRTEEIVEKSFSKTKCLLYVKGYWTFEYCYKKSMTQFHEEKKTIRSSEWSMGEFTNIVYGKTRDVMVRHVHDTMGQMCHENKIRRNTNVYFECCRKKIRKGLHIGSLNEPTLCTYKLVICVPDLCPGVGTDTGGAMTEETNDSSLRQECLKQVKSDKENSHPLEFYGLIWPNLVVEDSQELEWTLGLDAMTAISG